MIGADCRASRKRPGGDSGSEQPDNLVLTLRAIRATLDDHERKLDEVLTRVGRVEGEATTLNLRIAKIRVHFASLSGQLDNLDRQLKRIERRLGLAGADESS